MLAGPNWDQGLVETLKQDTYLIKECLLARKLPRLQNLRWKKVRLDNVKYYGEIENKEEFFRNVSICLCIENDSDHFSEKFFDCVQAGVVPLYCGPKLSLHNIPGGIAIEVGSNPREILSTLRTLNHDTISAFQENGSRWLENEFENWSEPVGMQRLATEITRANPSS
jgi:hypothetical protein